MWNRCFQEEGNHVTSNCYISLHTHSPITSVTQHSYNTGFTFWCSFSLWTAYVGFERAWLLMSDFKCCSSHRCGDFKCPSVVWWHQLCVDRKAVFCEKYCVVRLFRDVRLVCVAVLLMRLCETRWYWPAARYVAEVGGHVLVAVLWWCVSRLVKCGEVLRREFGWDCVWVCVCVCVWVCCAIGVGSKWFKFEVVFLLDLLWMWEEYEYVGLYH